MKIWLYISVTLFICGPCCATLSPPADKHRKDKGKYDNRKGSVEHNVFDRGLVVRDPKPLDILKESGLYCKDTKKRQFTGEVLGYITPWNSEGLEVAKNFHGKLASASPVWFTIPNGNVKKFQLPTHDVQKKWLKDIRALNDANHTVRILPRVLFEQWSPEEIVALNSDSKKKSQLVAVLADTAKSFHFDGYVLEIWNQFVFTGVDMKVVISLIKSLGKRMRSKNLQVILAIPPARGPEAQTFSQIYFDDLSPHINAFSLMTYDYSSVQRPGPNSPLEWAKECVLKLVPEDNDPRRGQILMGMNFYGNRFTPDGGGPIVGSQYLKFLESFKGKIQWDDRSKENFFETKTSIGSSYVFYPTLYSIKHRLELARELGTGVSIWELGQGLNYFYDLF